MDKKDDIEIVEPDELSKDLSVVEESVRQTYVAPSQASETYVIRATTPEYSGIWADLQVETWWSDEGAKFHCFARSYRAANNGRTSGNIHMKFSTALGSWGWVELNNDDAKQDENWYTLSDGGEIVANGAGATVFFSFIYDRGVGGDPNLTGQKTISFVVPAPSINVIRNVNSRTFPVSGAGGISGGTINVHNSGGYMIAPAVIQPDGKWTAVVPMSGNSLAFHALQNIGNTYSLKSATSTVYLSAITGPASNSYLEPGVIFKGIGAPGTTMRTVNADNHYFSMAPDVRVSEAGTWEAPYIPASPLPSGPVSVDSKFILASFPEGFTAPVTYKVAGVLAITSPAADSIQTHAFTVAGNGGFSGATVKVYIDLTQDIVGTDTVASDGTWSASVTVPLGPVSLVATQTFSGNESERSTPRAFKIRPPALTGVTDDILSATSVKFSGSGHEGAFVEITIVSGPAGAAPPVVQVVNGKWETTATNWPLGNYSLSAIQKVPDNSNGWIASPAYTFPVNLVLGPPTGVTYTAVYTPTFSGSGVNGATIEVTDRGSGALVAGAAPVVNQAWSTKAYTEWGPTKARPVRVVQKLGDTVSDPVDLLVTIAPLAPVINDIPPGEVSPLIDGTCWPGAVVKLKYSDQPAIEHLASVTGGVWSYRRTDPFTPENYTVTVTQTAADQLSPPASKTFTVLKPIPKPTIDPLEAEVGRDLIVTGGNGLKDATLQLRDAQFDRPLGQPKLLTSDGPWSIELKTLEFRHYTIDAQQSLDGRQSLRSEPVSSIVVLLPPTFEVPQPGSDLPRTSQLSGTGMPRGRVEVWLVGATEPLLKDIAVSAGGRWEAEVTLPIGVTTIRAKQFFEVQTSRDSPLLTYNVVPAAPFIETPTVDEHIGPRVVVSGFGVPGDTVTVKLGESPLGSSPVLEDRTWSVTVTLDHPGGVCGLVVAASSGDFESSASARSVVLGTYLPSIDVPAAGRWVNNPVVFEGLGRQGVGQVVSWYNPDVKWSANLPVGAGGWQGEAIQPLPGGGHWGRFKQTITDGAGAATVSDWVESERFEGPAPASN